MARSEFLLVLLGISMSAGLLAAQTPLSTSSQASASTHASLSAQAPAKPDFAKDVLPILRQNCVGCHGPSKQRGGMRLDRKSSVFKSISRRVVPGNSANSFVYHRIIGEYGAPMPPTGELRPEQIATIKNWIDQGAEWPNALANEADLPKPNPKAVAMVDALHKDDLSSFLKTADSDPSLLNARGPEGSTPLMYAVLYSDATTVARLLKQGADPNKHNDANATALMWAANDLEKTRLLLDHGAEVNVKSDDIRTPLMIAARHPGGAPVVKLLLDHGANPNPNARVQTESSPLLEGLTAGDAATVELLIQRGADVLATGEMGLFMAGTNDCSKCFDLLTARITDKAAYTGALQDIAVLGDVGAVRTLIDRGADVNAVDPLGRTALMYAAVSDVLPVDMVKLLIARGADVNAKDGHTKASDEGLTVLDIARRKGNTPVVDILLKAGAKSGGLTPVALKPRRDNDLRRAIQDSLPLLQKADVNFASNSGCVSCHNNSLTAMTLGLARKHGLQIDEQTASAQVKVNVEDLAKLRDRMHQGFVLPVADIFTENILSYQLLGLDAEGYKPDLSTDAAAMYILSRQRPDGQWFYPRADTRPPLCLDHIGQTALAMRALQLYAPKSNADAYRKSIRLAASWIAGEPSRNNDDRSWRLVGLAWADADKTLVQQAKEELLATQRTDGGWSDLPTMESSAYATGKSLVALQIAGLPVSDPAYQCGVKLLLNTQQEDGSWYVQSRAMAFQPSFDAGFPHGHNQWISSAGTNWAAMALTLALPDTTETASRSHEIVLAAQ